MPKRKKKRDQKKAAAKRGARIRVAKMKEYVEAVCRKAYDSYTEGGDILPMPSLTEALYYRCVESPKLETACEDLVKNFEENATIKFEDKAFASNMPNRVISFVIPLDFYIPLSEPYNAVSIHIVGDLHTATCCVTAFSDIIPIGESTAIKTSYLISSICQEGVDGITSIENTKEILGYYRDAILISNNLITAVQAIPSRHSHYMHQLTEKSLPDTVQAFIFDRKQKTIVEQGTLEGVTGYIWGNVAASVPLEGAELENFRQLHYFKEFGDDKVFRIVAKLNEAVCHRCFGRYEDAISAADTFGELALGYVYCCLRWAEGERYHTVLDQYAKIKRLPLILDGIREKLEFSDVEQLKTAIDYSEWDSKCRKIRNDIVHRFIVLPIDTKEALEALFVASNMVKKLCVIVQNHFTRHDEMIMAVTDFLKSSMLFVEAMHDDISRKPKSIRRKNK